MWKEIRKIRAEKKIRGKKNKIEKQWRESINQKLVLW